MLICVYLRRAQHVNVVEVARQKAAIPPAMRRTSSLWNRFLLDDELIKMGGLISKRKGLFSKKRQVRHSLPEIRLSISRGH
jgi:hypothetical protein